MRVEAWVLDASVAAKCFFEEEGSAAARAAVASRPDWIAPDLIFLEIASVASKAVRRGLIEPRLGQAAVAAIPGLIVEAVPCATLSERSFQLAAEHGVSAYDGAYLALAERRQTQLLTADLKLVARARDAGLGHLVIALETA